MASIVIDIDPGEYLDACYGSERQELWDMLQEEFEGPGFTSTVLDILDAVAFYYRMSKETPSPEEVISRIRDEIERQ